MAPTEQVACYAFGDARLILDVVGRRARATCASLYVDGRGRGFEGEGGGGALGGHHDGPTGSNLTTIAASGVKSCGPSWPSSSMHDAARSPRHEAHPAALLGTHALER